MSTTRRQKLGLYPNFKSHRETLGWSRSELLARIKDRAPSERALIRLEEGQAIRFETVNKVFNVIAGHWPPALDRDVELQVIHR